MESTSELAPARQDYFLYPGPTGAQYQSWADGPDAAEHMHEHAAPISQRWKWMTVLGNAAIGACELVTGNMTTLSVTADGLHNVGDAATYYMQSENILNEGLDNDRKDRLRKLSHYIIAASSLGIGAKAGYDLAAGQEYAESAFAIYTASASLALNGLMFARLRRGIHKGHNHTTVYEKDLLKHFLAIDIPSAALAVSGALLQKYSIHIEQVAAIASGLVGAIAFRPTKKNLSHNCLDHDHWHHHDDREKYKGRHRYTGPRRKRQKTWLERLVYKPRHAKAAN